jgi:hypothetical protein
MTSAVLSHGLSNSVYMNGDMFGASAAEAAAESASAGHTGGYGAGTVNQSNGSHHVGSSIHQTMPRFVDGQFPNGLDISGPQHPDLGEAHFPSTSTDTPPQVPPLGMDHAGSSPPVNGWGVSAASNIKQQGPEW